MKNKEKFEMLVGLAIGEAAPSVDVADGVMSILRGRRVQAEFSERPLMWVAAFSSVVALPAAVAAIAVYYSWTSPLAELVKSISWVTQ